MKELRPPSPGPRGVHLLFALIPNRVVESSAPLVDKDRLRGDKKI
jgi:hypothetical protein